jgi:hypothetical protein
LENIDEFCSCGTKPRACTDELMMSHLTHI